MEMVMTCFERRYRNLSDVLTVSEIVGNFE